MSSDGILSVGICRDLSDRSYERRKKGALSVERLVQQRCSRARVTAEGHDEATRLHISQIITFLVNSFIKSTQANHRKGGLIGLAGVALGLNRQTGFYLDVMLPAVCSLLGDQEARVRYYACESLYNISKASREAILLHFDRIFEGLCMLYEDPDAHVKEASALLDRLIKEFVSHSAEMFDLMLFVPRLRTHMNKTNPFVRELLLQWIILLNNTPGIELLEYLPKFLDGLFDMLEDDKQEIVKQTELVLGDFLREISASIHVDLLPMVGVVVAQVKNVKFNTKRRLYGLLWLHEMIKLGKFKLIPFYPEILIALLQCIHDEDINISAQSRKVSAELHALVKKIGGLPHTVLGSVRASPKKTADESDEKKTTDSGKEEAPASGRPAKRRRSPSPSPSPDGTSIGGNTAEEVESKVYELMEILCVGLQSDFGQTRIASLEWICMLLVHLNLDMTVIKERIGLFPVLLSLLCDADIHVLNLNLTVLSQVSVKPQYFHAILVNLLLTFKDTTSLLASRGKYIIEKLCELLGSKNVFVALSGKLRSDARIKCDLGFCSLMIQSMNLMLLTTDSPCIEELRHEIRNCKNSKENWQLFVSLFEPWCYNPVSTLSLCLLGEVYELGAKLILEFAHSDITVGFLMQVDKMISLLESPAFVHVRLQLLEPHLYPYLLKVLYGLLMLLPQNSAFNSLRIRLHCASSFGMLDCVPIGAAKSKSPASESPAFERNTDALFEAYVWTQSRFKSKKMQDITGISLLKGSEMPAESSLTEAIPTLTDRDLTSMPKSDFSSR